MKLKDYIRKEIENGETKFNIGINTDMEVNEDSQNRVKFEITTHE